VNGDLNIENVLKIIVEAEVIMHIILNNSHLNANNE
jgi:hypothetical protein